jgi:hypothetical protein
VTARLIDVHEAASYLSISPWTVRSLVANGLLVPVRLPSVRDPEEIGRRLLFDIRDLDAVIDALKKRSDGTPNADLAAAAITGRRNRRKAKREAV